MNSIFIRMIGLIIVSILSVLPVYASIDTDGDGLTDSWEIKHGLNPSEADSDNDGTTDDLEDSDTDGLSNFEEEIAGSNPDKKDSDGDGIEDFEDLHNDTPPGAQDVLITSHAKWICIGDPPKWVLRTYHVYERTVRDPITGREVKRLLPPRHFPHEDHRTNVDCGGSPPSSISFIRGDSNSDGSHDISDPITSLGYLFVDPSQGSQCLDAMDSNDDGKIDIADPITDLTNIFVNPPRDSGYMTCQIDLTTDDANRNGFYGDENDDLGCEAYSYCVSIQIDQDFDPSRPLEQDSDEDGVKDGSDNCPNVFNQNQVDTDSDGQGDACDGDDDNDGISDSIDNCPQSINPDQRDGDLDGIGDACDEDADGDEVVDTSDNCPFNFNPTQLDVDDDGLGDACDPDRDGDDLTDEFDNCPGHYNPNQSDQDDDGLGDACDTESEIEIGVELGGEIDFDF